MAKAETARKARARQAKSGISAHSVHPLIIRAAFVVSIWFIIVMVISFSGTVEADYLLAVVAGFSVIFFTLVLGLASYAASRGGEPDDDRFSEFLEEDVAVNTGSVSGREATVQILMLPVTLALGAMMIGFIFVIGA